MFGLELFFCISKQDYLRTVSCCNLEATPFGKTVNQGYKSNNFFKALFAIKVNSLSLFSLWSIKSIQNKEGKFQQKTPVIQLDFFSDYQENREYSRDLILKRPVRENFR